MKTKALKLGLALLGLLLVNQPSYADGVYIPAAKKKMPDIPVQRALVKYQGGTQALIIESTLSGENGDYGWIIPVPNQPNKLAKISPGLLKTMSYQIQPEIHHSEPLMRVFGFRIEVFWVMLVVITCFGIMRWGPGGGILPLALLVVSIYMLPTLDDRSGPEVLSKAKPLVKITSSTIVGNYDVLVLEVQDRAVLNTWLAKRGFSKFPVAAAPIIDDYIARGWVFAVAILKTIGGGMTTPHPILLEFETDQPVYPMRLTGLAGSTLYLELFIVGQNEAIPVNYHLTKEYCNHYDYGKFADDHEKFAENRYSHLKNQTGFMPRKRFDLYMEIAHPDASKIMWDGCVVTKWAGHVTSDEMMHDMLFQFKEAAPYRSSMFSSVGAYNGALFLMWVVCILVSILLTLYYGYRKIRGTKVSTLKLFIILLVASAAAFGLSYAMVGEKAEAYTVEKYWLSEFKYRLADHCSIPSHCPFSESDFIEILAREGIYNPVTHEPIINEHSPGNLVFEGEGDRMELKICLENGSVYALY